MKCLTLIATSAVLFSVVPLHAQADREIRAVWGQTPRPREMHAIGVRPQSAGSGAQLGSDPKAPQIQTPPLRLTLAEAVSRGLDSSHRVAEAIARGEAADAAAGGRHAAT